MRQPPDKAERRPRRKGGVPNDTRGNGVGASVADLDTWRQRRAQLRGWLLAVRWLHAHGLPAAVPDAVAAWLACHDAEADWYYRNPCHGCGGCYVLAMDSEDPPPEIHVCEGPR